MSVRYVTVALGHPQNPMAPKKFYLSDKSLGSIGEVPQVNKSFSLVGAGWLVGESPCVVFWRVALVCL